ncbi:hypothetical protein LTR62_003298 [Meristemomyces frigidus]|uniref:Uncharacterized protein n=1 Tax=Meristemomyces frigidus TaxID=1508187 RepID=A0AAN7TF67_9PEZI|nr:hypothetical protein LTR62_003298 [Meristemomyces frigidus]
MAAANFIKPVHISDGAGLVHDDEVRVASAEEVSEVEPSQPAATDFQPLFVLVEDEDSGEHHHPSVHYVFADDDPDDLTASTLDTIEQQTGHHEEADLEERVVIVDMSPAGTEIMATASLSSHWQALKTSICQAPSWGGAAQHDQSRLTLRISGQEVSCRSEATPHQINDIDTLMDRYNEQLRGLDELLASKESTQA